MGTPEFVLSLRERIGHELLWMSGVTAVVVDPGRERMLAVRRADTGAWTPVTGIIDPGEQPAEAALREVAEEADVSCRALRLVDVRTLDPVTYVNGDRAQFLNLTFLCEYTGGDPSPADGENLEARWFPLGELPPMSARQQELIEIALSPTPEARFAR